MKYLRALPLGVVLILPAVVACGTKEESSTSVRASEKALEPAAADKPAAAGTHYKVEAVYENGQFTVLRLFRIKSQLHQRRSGTSGHGIRYVARSGAQALHAGLMPDVREFHDETFDPTTGHADPRPAANAPPRPVRFLIDVPATTQRIDFYEAHSLTVPMPPPPEQSGPVPLGSIDLTGVPEVTP